MGPKSHLYKSFENVMHHQEAWKKNLLGDNSLQGERPASWWTGKRPLLDECPGMDSNGKIHSLPMLDLRRCTPAQLRAYFDNAWLLNEMLFSALQDEEAFYRPPYHQLRHPMIFYYLHPVVFYINKLRLAGLIKKTINPYFEYLFEVGVDEMSWDDLSKNHIQWPRVHECTDYRAAAYQLISGLIETHPDLAQPTAITPESPLWALIMGIEHERIHLETSSVLIRELPIHLVKKPRQWPDYFPLQQRQGYPINPLITVEAGQAVLGKAMSEPSYGWDNEYGQKNIAVKHFRASACLISNGEFFEFVTSGGYQQKQYWSEEGWQWRSFKNSVSPTFWILDEMSDYKLRLCFDSVPMQWSWPVEVNYHEAAAYCAWRTAQEKSDLPYRLITEAEHHRLRDPSAMSVYNHHLRYASPSTVNSTLPTKLGFYDVFGNVWQWSDDHFAALPGFKTHPLYEDFSTPCFDAKHNIILGGSFISTGEMAEKWARFHFRRHFFQHAGFRIAQSCL